MDFYVGIDVSKFKHTVAIIDQNARNAHNVILLPYFFEMVNIVYLCRDILIFCRNMLRGYYGIGAHRARQGYEHLNISRLAYRPNSFSCFFLYQRS